MGCLRTRGYAKESRLSFGYGFGVAGSQSANPIRFEQWRPATKASKIFQSLQPKANELQTHTCYTSAGSLRRASTLAS